MIPALTGPAADSIILDEDTELFWTTHRAHTGCQRPRSLAWLCTELQSLAENASEGEIAQELPASFTSAVAACKEAGHDHGATLVPFCVGRQWKRHAAETARRLDALVGIVGCHREAFTGGRR